MKRRNFLIGCTAVFMPGPLHAQPANPVVGVLHSGNKEATKADLIAIKAGMAQLGIEEGRNASFEFRFAEGHLDRLPGLAAELVSQKVTVIFSGTNLAPTLALKAATSTIPIVFYMGADPISSGIVDSLSRPGGNITGVTILAGELFPKRLQLLHDMLPDAKSFGFLVNQSNPAFSQTSLENDTIIARSVGLRLLTQHGNTLETVEKAFASFVQEKIDGVILAPDTSYQVLIPQIIALASTYRMPVSYPGKQYVEAGGLMSYGTDPTDLYRRCGTYIARILKGELPKNLPVQQPVIFELAINKKAATKIGLQIPATLIAQADRIIE